MVGAVVAGALLVEAGTAWANGWDEGSFNPLNVIFPVSIRTWCIFVPVALRGLICMLSTLLCVKEQKEEEEVV